MVNHFLICYLCSSIMHAVLCLTFCLREQEADEEEEMDEGDARSALGDESPRLNDPTQQQNKSSAEAFHDAMEARENLAHQKVGTKSYVVPYSFPFPPRKPIQSSSFRFETNKFPIYSNPLHSNSNPF